MHVTSGKANQLIDEYKSSLQANFFLIVSVKCSCKQLDAMLGWHDY